MTSDTRRYFDSCRQPMNQYKMHNYLDDKKKLQAMTSRYFMHDLDRAFFFGEHHKGPKNFTEIFDEFSNIEKCKLRERFRTLTLQRIKMELENIVKRLGYQFCVSYKRWYCSCRGRGRRHNFPERVCVYCGVGIRMYDSNFGVTFSRE